MSDDFDWSGAPEGERYERLHPIDSTVILDRYVVNGETAHYWDTTHNRWLSPAHRASEDIRTFRRVADDLHPLVPGQQAIDWADELLRDPEVAGWTEAWVDRANEGLTVDASSNGSSLSWSYTARNGAWISVDDILKEADKPYRRATTMTKKETMTVGEIAAELTDMEKLRMEHEEFKARVYKVGKAAAKEHGWCSVFDELMEELGIEPPKIEWPKPGTLFKSKIDGHVAITVDEHRFIVIRRANGVATHEMERGRRFTFVDSFTSLDQLEVIPV